MYVTSSVTLVPSGDRALNETGQEFYFTGLDTDETYHRQKRLGLETHDWNFSMLTDTSANGASHSQNR